MTETQRLLAFTAESLVTHADGAEQRRRVTRCVALALFVGEVGAERERVRSAFSPKNTLKITHIFSEKQKERACVCVCTE